MVYRDFLPPVGDLVRLVWGLSGALTPSFASRLGVNACYTCGGVTLYKILDDDDQL